MKKNSITRIILIFSLLFCILQPCFAEDTTPLPYDKNEFPQGLKDLRRFEIITLGALPFVTLDTTLMYSCYRYVKSDYNEAYTPNLFSASTYTSEEQKKIILTSVGICVGIGLTDYAIQLIKRSKAKKREKLLTYDDISIYPISEDPEAVAIPITETTNTEPSSNLDDDYIQVIDDEIQEVDD